MRASELGERKIIALLTRELYKNPRVLVGAGEDDAAILSFGEKELVAKSDIMFRSTHFPKAMKPEQMGRKVAVANISDLAAMGASPVATLFSFGVPPDFNVSEFARIVNGINAACSQYDAPFVGGDTKQSKDLTICGIALGELEKGEAILRRNAHIGDIVAVTGEIGNAALGLEILLKGMKIGRYGKLVNAFLNPSARVKEGRAIAQFKIEAAGMDITDGLFFSAGELARMSKVCLSLDRWSIPISKEAKRFAEEHNVKENYLLNNGEDYELVVTIRRERFEEVKDGVEDVGGSLIQIGNVIKGRGVLIDGKRVKISGYDSLKYH